MWRKIIIFTLFVRAIDCLDLEVVNRWNFLNFNFPYDYDLVNSFRPENTVFTGLEITKDRIFLAMPRLRSGVPATLATIPRNTPPGSSPSLDAYPNWNFHGISIGNSDNCTGIISVYRIRVDSCNQLWVLDSGVMTSLEDFRPICPPKILVFDLNTDQIVRRIVFPRQVLRPSSLLTNIVIDESIQGRCDRSFVYMTDTAAPGLVVYDGVRDTAWRIMHPAMFPDPDFSDYTVAGETFTLMDGIVGMAHSPKLATLFFQPLATDRIFSIPTRFLTKGPPAEFETVPVILAGNKASQGLGLALNPNDDTLFFSPVSETSVASWNPITNQQKLVAFNPDLLQFATELRWPNNNNGDDDSLWLLSTRFQKFFKKTVTGNEINLRIIRIRAGPRISSGFSNSIYFK